MMSVGRKVLGLHNLDWPFSLGMAERTTKAKSDFLFIEKKWKMKNEECFLPLDVDNEAFKRPLGYFTPIQQRE